MRKKLDYTQIFLETKDWKNLNASYTDEQYSPAIIQLAHRAGTLLYEPGVKLVITSTNIRKTFSMIPNN